MKGLMRNNLYAVGANAKIFLFVMLFFGTFVAAVISQPLLLGYTLISIVGFSLLSLFSLGKESASKWGKYKLTLPVSRRDILKSYFFGQLLWMSVGSGLALMVIGASVLLHGCLFDRGVDVVLLWALGMSMGLFVTAIFFPLHCMGDGERNEVFLLLSLLCAVGIVMGLSSWVNGLFDHSMTTVQLLLGAGLILLCGAAGFVLSFFLTDYIFRKKEY